MMMISIHKLAAKHPEYIQDFKTILIMKLNVKRQLNNNNCIQSIQLNINVILSIILASNEI